MFSNFHFFLEKKRLHDKGKDQTKELMDIIRWTQEMIYRKVKKWHGKPNTNKASVNIFRMI